MRKEKGVSGFPAFTKFTYGRESIVKTRRAAGDTVRIYLREFEKVEVTLMADGRYSVSGHNPRPKE